MKKTVCQCVQGFVSEFKGQFVSGHIKCKTALQFGETFQNCVAVCDPVMAKKRNKPKLNSPKRFVQSTHRERKET